MGGRGRDELRELTAFLQTKERTDIIEALNYFNSNILDRRHLPVHSYRIFMMWHKGKMYVPLDVKEEMIWTEAKGTIEWNRSDKQLKSDLDFVEKLLNSLHQVLIEEYGSFIDTKKIIIDREGS